MHLEGLWNGQFLYDDQCKTERMNKPVDFSISIVRVGLNGIFEATCQELPTLENVRPATSTIYGKLGTNEIRFTKQYPFVFGFDQGGKFLAGDESHPEIFYNGTYTSKEQFYGTWKMEATFRKINGHVCELLPTFGFWWMKKSVQNL